MIWHETGHSSKAALIAEVEQLVKSLSDHLEEMEPHERRFVEQTDSRLSDFGAEVTITPKQLFWLRDLNIKY
jgi:hypothetical protein